MNQSSYIFHQLPSFDVKYPSLTGLSPTPPPPTTPTWWLTGPGSTTTTWPELRSVGARPQAVLAV